MRVFLPFALGLCLAPTAQAQIIVNEFFADPVGADTGLEWLELVNISDTAVDLVGWEIQRATTFWSIRHIFPYSIVLYPGEHLVVGEPGVAFADETVATLSLGNALSTGDGIRVCNAFGQIKDVVIYGPNNTDNLYDDSGAIATSLGPAPMEGLSVARIPTAADTDLSADDWHVVQLSTPGAPNLPDPADTADTGTPDTSETAGGGTGHTGQPTLAETGDTAPPAETADTAPPAETADTAPPAETADTAAPVHTADTAGTTPTDPTDTADTAASETGDTAPTDPTETADTAASETGDTASPDPIETADTARDPTDTADTAPAPVIDTAIPTDDTSDTGETTDTDPYLPVSCTDARFAIGLVINEILAEPAGMDPGHQWVEIFNRSGYDLDLSGWLVMTGETELDRAHTIPDGTFLPDGDYMVFGAAGAETQVALDGLWLGDGDTSDAIQIRDCMSTPVDTVIYGPDNADAWRDDLGEIATSVGPTPPVGRTIGRVPDGGDTQDSGVDFSALDTPTPGTSNQLPPLTCGGPDSGVVINEVYRGAGPAEAWVEILHTGELPIALEGWTVEIGRVEWSAAYAFAAGENLLPGGRIVVGSPSVPEVGYPSTLSIGGGTGGDIVRLVDCRGFASDSVIYGAENADGWPDDSGRSATSLAIALSREQSLSRLPDGRDSDLCAEDFELASATPGRANAKTTDTGDPSGSTSDTGGRAEPSGCSCETGRSAPALWMFVLLALLRRRR